MVAGILLEQGKLTLSTGEMDASDAKVLDVEQACDDLTIRVRSE